MRAGRILDISKKTKIIFHDKEQVTMQADIYIEGKHVATGTANELKAGSRINTTSKLKIIAIGAHGDDIELACGGTLAKAIKHGHDVSMVLVTGGGLNDHNNVTIRNKDEAIKEAEAL